MQSSPSATAPSRRAAQIGLGAAVVVLIACVVLIMGASAAADSDRAIPHGQSTAARPITVQ
jgi:hypothetical protein